MNWIKNYSLLLFFSAISVLTAELVLRVFIGPPTNISNRQIDENFGYKVSPKLADIDSMGFRNSSVSINDYDLAAIGDSHTYGYNVPSSASWPKILGKNAEINVYNFGVGGNGIYSYHYLASAELEKGKKVILGLFMPNDFQSNGYACSINFKNDFWLDEVERLGLAPPSCDISTEGSFHNFAKRILLKSTFGSLFYYEVYNRIRVVFASHDNLLEVGGGLKPIKYGRLDIHSADSDLSSKDVKARLNDFLKILKDWKNKSEQGQLGIILIPSRQFVYRALIESNNDEELYLGFKELVRLTENEFNLETYLMREVRSIGIPILSSKTQIALSLMNSIKANGEDKFYPDGGHPSFDGYEAYANTAKRLLVEMKTQTRLKHN